MTDRIEQSKEKYEALFRNIDIPAFATDPDFREIKNRFIFGEVYYHGSLSDRQRELIVLVVLATNQTLLQLREHVGVALNVGLTPVEIKEAIYQCAPYIGFPKALNALVQANEVFVERNITLPLESQTQVNEDNRHEKGVELRVAIFGDQTRQLIQNAPENQKHIQDYLSGFCFGEIYSRSGLDIKTRELLTLCILSALGGCESQLKGHVQGNLNVGNDRDVMIEAITQCMPYMGFPRTLNALNCVGEIL
jgi:4-carboxymuconolactone decarboxylase